jgi:uncharacterized protein YjbJ (UPF0337 family)
MDKDRVKGKAKDITGRVQRQVGEWTGDEEQQIKGTGKQVEGKVQNMAGKVKDAVKGKAGADRQAERERERENNRMKREDENAA